MPAKHEDLHGNAPDKSRLALVLVDVINDLEFEGGERMLEHALSAAQRIAELKARATAAGVPTIYANDNFGRWRSNLRGRKSRPVDHCKPQSLRRFSAQPQPARLRIFGPARVARPPASPAD